MQNNLNKMTYCNHILGKGAFSEVYLVKDTNTNTLMAMKVIKEKSVDPIKKIYLQNEIEILKIINHPNIIKFYEEKRYHDKIYVFLEYCNGGSLRQYLYSNPKPFSERLVQKIIKQILLGVNYLHNNGIIHRDLKLDNILIHYNTKNDLINKNIFNAKIKIIDFNISYKNNTFRPISFVGTLPNMAPSIIFNEMESNKEFYDEKVDIWSLGTLCYEMLFRNSLFPNIINKEELYNILKSGNFYIPKTISYQARNFLYSMLEIDGTKRLSTAQLLKHEFIIKDYSQFSFYKNNIKNNINVQKQICKNNLMKQDFPIKAYNTNVYYKIINVIFRRINSKALVITTKDNITIEELIKLYLIKINRHLQLSNNNSNILTFIYNGEQLNKFNHLMIREVLSGDNPSITVIGK